MLRHALAAFSHNTHGMEKQDCGVCRIPESRKAHDMPLQVSRCKLFCTLIHEPCLSLPMAHLSPYAYTGPVPPSATKSRIHSPGVNPYSPSFEYRPVLCRLEARGVDEEVAGQSFIGLFPLDGSGFSVWSFRLRPASGTAAERVPPRDTMPRFIGFVDKSRGIFYVLRSTRVIIRPLSVSKLEFPNSFEIEKAICTRTRRGSNRSNPGRAMSVAIPDRIRACYNAGIRDENTVPVG